MDIKQKIEYLPVENLKVHPDNPRLIKDNQFKKLCESVKANPDYFETRPILANKDLVIFAGNMRWRAAKEVGLKEVPVAVMDIPEARQREIMIRDNRENGEWDWDKLANDFEIDELANWGLDDFDIKSMTKIDEPKEDDFDSKIETTNECPKCGYKW